MAKQILAFVVAVVAVATDCDIEYEQLLAKFPDKKRSPDRKALFCKTFDYIQEQNSANRRFTLGINQFSDWTKDEFKAILGGRRSKPEVNASTFKPALGFKPLDSVDWRPSMPPIKNQGSCGSCWAFAAIDVVDFEAAGSHSEQQLVDCSGQGCGGGDPYHALSYLQGAGSDPESTYPYTQKDGSCDQSGRVEQATVSNVQRVNGEVSIAHIVSQQVVAVCVNAGSFDDFQHYSSGVYDSDCGSGDKEGHCFAIVGYTDDYWIIRNSWGTSWGQSGYMYFKRGSDLCNIGTRNGGVFATASYKPRFGSCDTSGGGVICTCTTGCGLRDGESTPCVAPAGTDCSGGFSGATCCSEPACDVGKTICQCTTGCGLGEGGSVPCACAMGTDCSQSFSGCSCCGAVNLAAGRTTNITGGHTGGFVADARFGGCSGSGSGSAIVV